MSKKKIAIGENKAQINNINKSEKVSNVNPKETNDTNDNKIMAEKTNKHIGFDIGTISTQKKSIKSYGGKQQVEYDNPEKQASTVANVTPDEPELSELFIARKYKEIKRMIDPEKVYKLNDSEFLYYCGAILNVEIDKLGDYVFSRSVNDGYLEYLRGRYLYSQGKWETACERFLNALAKKPIINCDEEINYYLVASSYKVYQEKPNVEKKEFFKAQKDDYLRRFCENTKGTTNCEVVKMYNTSSVK